MKRRVTILVTHIRGLIALLTTTLEPPSNCGRLQKLQVGLGSWTGVFPYETARFIL